MSKVLILGGTKYFGKKTVTLLLGEGHEIMVASRRQLPEVGYILLDRKDTNSLDNALKWDCDFIIDFINYSGPDSEKLLDALQRKKTKIPLIHISTTYVYGNPSELGGKNVFKEEDFNANLFKPIDRDFPDISYIEGKQSAEHKLAISGMLELCILRFPIIVGSDDTTKRTQYFRKLQDSNRFFEPYSKGGRISLISVSSAASVIKGMIARFTPGTYNVANPSFLNQIEIGNLLGNSKNVEYQCSSENSPFYSKNDMLIDTSKIVSLGYTLPKIEDELIKINLEIRNSI